MVTTAEDRELVRRASEILAREIQGETFTPYCLHEARRLLDKALGLIPGMPPGRTP